MYLSDVMELLHINYDVTLNVSQINLFEEFCIPFI